MNDKRGIRLISSIGFACCLAACGNHSNQADFNETVPTTKVAINQLKLKTTNTANASKNGVLKLAEVTDATFAGIFSDAFAESELDTLFFKPANESLFTTNKELKMTAGAAQITFDEPTKTVTITLNEQVTWNDGQKVTADDLLFPYLVIGNQEYTGVRYDATMKNIVGMEAYHDGQTDSISGIKKISDKAIQITYQVFTPSILQNANDGVLNYAMPAHAFAGIAVKDMATSDPVRKTPLSFGPFYVSKIIAGESVTFSPNRYYYAGTPQVAKIYMRTLPTSAATASMKAREFDIYDGMPSAEYTSWKGIKGYELLGQQETAYNYIGFKLGKWDAEKGENVMDPTAKMASQALRQAIGYAIDNDAIGRKLYNGLQIRANSLIVPAFGTKYDATLPGYTKDVKKANQLLDDAGFKDRDGDGYREDQTGKKLEINFAVRDRGTTEKSLAEYSIQSWKEIGLHVKLATGRLIETNSFYDKIQADDPSIDMYAAGWQTGLDPNQTGLYGADAKFNFSRFVSAENTALLDNMSSQAAFDETQAAQIYKEWQAYANKQAFVIPTTYTIKVTPVSKRVTNYDISRDLPYNNFAKVGVMEPTR